jgi:HK97 family phage prohead protease
MSQATKQETRELRQVVEGLELRAAPAGSSSPGTLVGYAAIFEKYSCDLGYFREKLQRGAFAKALKTSDTRALANHDPSQLLGRKSAGTLRMDRGRGRAQGRDRPTGHHRRARHCRVRSPRRHAGPELSASPRLSIEWDWSGETTLRTVIEIEELFDVGPVTYPAYEETSVAMRSFSAAKAKHELPPPPPGYLIESERDQARIRLLDAS